jgi:Ca2+/Na+ antiporter
MAQSFHAFFLLRRSVSVVIATFLVSDPHAKQIVLLFWLLTSLLVSLATKPFRDFLDNLLNTFSLTVLCLIAALELHYVSFVSDKPERVSFIQLVLIVLFVLCVPFVFVSRYLLDRRHEAVNKAVKEGSDIPAPATGCVARTHTRTVSFCRRVCANNFQGHSIFDDSQYDSDDVTELRRKQLLYAKMRERDQLSAEHDRMAAAGIVETQGAVQAARAASATHQTGAAASGGAAGAAAAGHPALASRTGPAAAGSRVVKW